MFRGRDNKADIIPVMIPEVRKRTPANPETSDKSRAARMYIHMNNTSIYLMKRFTVGEASALYASKQHR